VHDDQSSVAWPNSGAEHDQVLAPVAEAIRGSPNVTLRSGHHVSQDAAVLGAVNALRLRFDRANVSRPTGIDSACAQRMNTAFT
jgi:hypothetical protein